MVQSISLLILYDFPSACLRVSGETLEVILQFYSQTFDVQGPQSISSNSIAVAAVLMDFNGAPVAVCQPLAAAVTRIAYGRWCSLLVHQL